MSKLRLGDESINFSQERVSKVEIIKENEIGGVSSYELESDGDITRASFDVGDSFSDIKSIDDYVLFNAFSNCTGLTGSVNFPNLTSIGTSGLTNAFYNCTGLTGSVNFPNLTSVGDNALNKAFYNCTGITEIHFRADAQATIEAQSTYSSKFGATNATIYFDL